MLLVVLIFICKQVDVMAKYAAQASNRITERLDACEDALVKTQYAAGAALIVVLALAARTLSS
jgi:hypothetical protein